MQMDSGRSVFMDPGSGGCIFERVDIGPNGSLLGCSYVVFATVSQLTANVSNPRSPNGDLALDLQYLPCHVLDRLF